ncbi:MAG: sugar phosphate isomerase/epimerase family protein [Saprospiraceae bacterium]
MKNPRRDVLKKMIALPLVGSASFIKSPVQKNVNGLPVKRRLKSSLNAFSFNEPLTAGTMDIFEMLTYSADLGFEGIDITGYYFKGYPKTPELEFLYKIKRHAHAVGIEISGTGVRNDFTIPDKSLRILEVNRVISWIETAARLGAPVLRIFGGAEKREGFTREQITNWMLEDINKCVDYGKQNGVIIGLQNHNDFILNTDIVAGFMKAIPSPWFGLILDTGSYRQEDPYLAVEKTIQYAVNWQIKEKIFVNGIEVDTDLSKLFNIIKKSKYKGYLPIETLGKGDPKPQIEAFFPKVLAALNG